MLYQPCGSCGGSPSQPCCAAAALRTPSAAHHVNAGQADGRSASTLKQLAHCVACPFWRARRKGRSASRSVASTRAACAENGESHQGERWRLLRRLRADARGGHALWRQRSGHVEALRASPKRYNPGAPRNRPAWLSPPTPRSSLLRAHRPSPHSPAARRSSSRTSRRGSRCWPPARSCRRLSGTRIPPSRADDPGRPLARRPRARTAAPAI